MLLPLRSPLRSRALVALVGSALATAAAGGALTTVPAHANPGGTGLVISEVYGAGGNAGAVYNADYVELYNPTGSAISVAGDYVHYRSAAGGSGGTPAQLTGSVPAHGHYLIQMGASSATNGVALPTPDAGPFTFNLAAAGGQVYLLDNATAITTSGNMAGVAHVLDMMGASGATSYETAATSSPASTSSSLNRTADGSDTDDNATDFSLAAPTPESSASSGGTEPTEHTIAEIQGDGASSPLAGQQVITQGVVTAAYPTGGFFGYVIQTDGTGSGADATPGQSDAVFVHQPSGAVTVGIGDYVQVTGTVSEFNGLTELSVAAADVQQLGPPPSGGVTARQLAYPTTEAGREAHESELIEPTDRFTVTDNFDANNFGEIGLATGDHQLWQPTDLYNPGIDPAGVSAVEADNAARGVVLNDGSSWNYLTTDKDTVMPWLRPDNPVRIGSTATLHQPVILDYRNGLWELQPTQQVTDDGSEVATFSDTRTANQAPQQVGGDLRLGTFNVENFFPTSAADYEAMVGDPAACTAYTDRQGNPVDVRQCSPNGPRGAWDATNLDRQLVKEVTAINTMDADVMSLEEIENSVQFDKPRDSALSQLVDALNADAGFQRWAFVPSPSPENLPPTAEQDVIRTAFIYNPGRVQLVGSSTVLSDQSDPGEPFANAREPLAQEFKRKGALDSDGFLVVVNHFKSKGDSSPPATGDNADGIQGAFNGDRVRQAHALVDFAKATAQADGTKKIFLVGDFNSYTQEDPMQVLYQNGFVNQPSDDARDTSYEFGGMAGSLDHVLANTAAANLVTGRDVWQTNAEESVAFEYSRYNYNAELLYRPDQFRASDHNPELVGLSVPYSQQGSSVDVGATPGTVKKKKGTAEIDVSVTGDQGVTPTGTVQFWVDGQQVAAAPVASDGTASATIGPFPNAGVRHVEVRYSGDRVTQPGTASTTVAVVNASP
jgi:predicted extracellular nuclease